MKAKQILAYCIGLFLSASSMAVKVECKKEGLLHQSTRVVISDESGLLGIIFHKKDLSLLTGEYESIKRIYNRVSCDFSKQSTTCIQAALDNFTLAENIDANIYELLIQRKGKKAKNIIFQKNECSFSF